MQMTTAEQSYVDEMVRTRSTDVAKPVWIQAQRARVLKREAQRQIEALPPVPSIGKTGDKIHYHAGRRVAFRDTMRRSWQSVIHEADADGLPICPMHETWEDEDFQDGRFRRLLLEGGGVTCGRCAAVRS
jgi:hypothetical protein